ncbi:MAG TPA: SDR family oxidoreductase [Thermoanaerobaculia bacterium]|nr:SDR family oxidoreductase [Thermoanaerobaculia bacterium]
MDLGITGRVAMVAASTKGIGRAVATSLLAEGCRVSICARTAVEIEAAREEMAAAAPITEVFGARCDVSKQEDLAAWHAETVERFGAVDILVTNSGGPPAARFLDLTEAQWREGIDTVLFNVIRLSRLVLPAMRERRWGRIIHLTSLVAKQPVALLTVSSALRAGLSALTKTMSNEFSKDGVLVNAVLPGHILTDRQKHLNEIRSKEEGISTDAYAARVAAAIPIGRHGQPEEIGDVVAFLASERASYVTGATIQVDGGIIQSTF